MADRYDAFISYSHAADGLLAPRLQAGLQRFAKPWWKRRAIRVFRDEASLSANPHLWSSITDALDQSEWFVLLLSPDAAASPWVNDEVAYWIQHKSADRILPVVTDGEFGPEVYPPALSVADEPRWVDLRFAKEEDQLDLKNPGFSAAVADIASAVRGVPKDELEGEEVKQYRRTIRTAFAAAVLLSLSAIAAIGFAARSAASEARANDEARVAQARSLATASVNVLAQDPELSLLLAVVSADAGNEVEFEQRRALHAAIDQDRAVLTLEFDEPWIWTTIASVSPDRTLLAAFGQRGVIQFYDIADLDRPQLLWTYRGVPVEYTAIPIFTTDNRHVIVDVTWPEWDQSVPTNPSTPDRRGVYLFDARTGTELTRPTAPSVCTDPDLISYSPFDWTDWATVDAYAGSCGITDEVGVPRGNWWWVQNLLTGEIVRGPTPVDEPLFAAETKANGTILHYQTSHGLTFLDLLTGEETLVPADFETFDVKRGGVDYVRIDARPGFAVTGALINRHTGQTLELNPDPSVLCNFTVGVTPSGDRAAIGCDDGSIRVLDRASGDVVLSLRGHAGWPAVMLDASGGYAVSGSTDGFVKVWELSPRGEVQVIQTPPGLIADASLTVVGTKGAVLVFPTEDTSLFSAFISTMERMAIGEAWVFDTETGEQIARIDNVSGKVVRLSPDGTRLAAQTVRSGVLGPVATFNAETGTLITVMKGMCSWDPDVLATAPFSADGTIGDCRDGDLAGDATDIAWSPEGRFLAVAAGSSQQLRVWDSTTGDVVFTTDRLGFFTFALSAVQFSPDGSRLAVSSKTGMWLFDTSTWTEVGRVTHTGRPSWAIRFTPDGSSIVTAQAHSGWVRVYDAQTLEQVDYRASGAQSRDLALSSDGALAALASKEGQIHVIDLSTGEVIEVIDRFGADLTNVEFVDGDRRLIISPAHGPIEIVTLDVEELVSIARARISRALTAEECRTYSIAPCPTLEEIRAG